MPTSGSSFKPVTSKPPPTPRVRKSQLDFRRRKVAAMGGMSAQIPIKDDLRAHEVAMGKVRADKLREVKNGHDGTWVAHPFLNNIASEVFNQYMLGPNQVCFVWIGFIVDGDLSDRGFQTVSRPS